jgi:lipopolysaccharide export system permease protein
VIEILQNPTRENIAELHWRIGLPVSLLMLSLIAIPLSYVNTRSARSANLIIAILCYMIYYNFMSIAQSWTVTGRVNPVVGIWPVHLIFFGVFILMMSFRSGFGGLFRKGH